MEQKRYDMVIEAQTPIAHHAEVFGNSAILMRRKIRQPDGSWATVPIVTADTMRHGLREAAAYATLDAAGLLDNPGLSEAALRLLFAGGMITGRGDASAVKLDSYREMVDLVPPLALLGGCANNRVIPGRLFVDDALLICAESEHLLPAWVREWLAETKQSVDTCRAHVEEVQRVRMDPTLDPGKRKLLASSADAEVQKRLAASEAAHDADDAVARTEAKSSMMPRRFETVCQGSMFFWSIAATTYSDLDLDVFNVMLGAFLRSARVGGKRGTGHGAMRPVTARQIKVVRPRDTPDNLDVGALAPKMGSVFYDHVKGRADRVREFLSTVDA
jgi:hypothetical protein